MIDPEDQIAAEIAAAEARGEDPYADREPAEPEEKQAEATTDQQAKEPDPEAAKPADPVEQVPDEEPEKAKADDAKSTPEQETAPVNSPPVVYQTTMPEDYQARRLALVTEKSELLKKLMDGEIDVDAYVKGESLILDSIDALKDQQIVSRALQEANIQTQAAFQKQEIKKLVESTKSEVDYASDTKAQKQFDIALKSIASDADNANLSYTQIITEAHKVVMALRGISKPKAEVTQRPKREAPQPPQTLSGLPTAASNSAKSIERTLAELSGDDLERAFDALPKSELDRINKLS